jgi:phosphatidylserine/phosphatidylglycerophosphate/cardiolipin synthase-like enzyme
MSSTARAIANNDIVHIAWSVDSPIPDCAGFVIYRQPADGSAGWEPLRSLIEFEDDHVDDAARPTTVTPVTKFQWRDFLDRASRDKAVRYKIVAVRKEADSLDPVPGVQPLLTNDVTPTEHLTDGVEVYFNRGILATQALVRLLAPYGGATVGALQKALSDPTGIARTRLSGELQQALLRLLEERKEKRGHCYAALYELTDKVLLDALLEAQGALRLVLSNNTGDRKKGYDYANSAARTALTGSKVQLVSRYLPDGRSIGHNKFMVLTDGSDQPKAVLTGSTNWTRSGLCTQSNNAVIVRSPGLAAEYVKYWRALEADTQIPGIPKKAKPFPALQGPALRAADATRPAVATLQDGKTTAWAWFSPNTPTLVPKSPKGKKRPPTPPDMQDLFDAINGAQQAVLLLAFQPGAAFSDQSWTVVKELAGVCKKKPWLFVRGAISDAQEAMEFEQLRTPEMDAEIVAPAGILKDEERWQQEIAKAGHAIVHNKIVVIDPFLDSCLVVTGSHNLGFKASYNNDENMLFIRGNRAIAEAYAAHVADVFQHYRWRWYEQRSAQQRAAADWVKAGSSVAQSDRVDVKRFYDIDFDPTAPKEDWQARYFDEARLAMRDREFWVGTGQRLKALQPPPGKRRVFGYTTAERALADARKQLKEQKKAARTASAKGAAPRPGSRAKEKRVSKGKTRR